MTNASETGNSLKSLKIRNRKLVLAFLRKVGAVSVNSISQATGLSKMTVHKIIDHYIQEGMVAIVGKGASTEEGGKKPNLFSFNPNCRFIFAIRLDGNRLSTSIVNLKGDTVVPRSWKFLENMDYEETMALIGQAFQEQLRTSGLAADSCLAVVAGCSGIVDSARGIGLTSYQFPEWRNNVPLLEGLKQQMPEHVFLHVDSWWRHMAHGELYLSDIGERKTFFLIGNSSNYISGGLVSNGRVCHGENGFAGEIGHMVVSPGCEVECVCGGHGCLESLVAPARVAERAEKLRGEYPDSTVFPVNWTNGGDFIKKLADASAAGDELAKRLLDEAIGHIAVAISNVIHVCDPGLILVFGDYSKAGEQVMEALREKVMHLNLRGIEKRTRIECSALDENSGVIGAANFVTDVLFAGGV